NFHGLRNPGPAAGRPLFAALHMSASDAVDGSSTGTEVPSGLGAVKAPTIRRRSQDANDHSEQSGRLTPQRTAPALLYERTRLFSSSAGRHWCSPLYVPLSRGGRRLRPATRRA